MYRRLLFIFTIGACVGLLVIPLSPINSTRLNSLFIVCTLGTWSGILFFTWRIKLIRYVLFVIPVLLAIPFCLPGPAIEAKELRADYLRRLATFEGTKYVWGGESRRGIDCSGLPRRTFRDALLAYGIKHANGLAFRANLEQWWFDASANALGEGYRNYTKPIGLRGTIREMDYHNLLPGDLAVTIGGSHVLVYVGDERWIQADPGIGTVAVLNGRTNSNVWFTVPVTIHRWEMLSYP
jgi:NlpC/P60 family